MTASSSSSQLAESSQSSIVSSMKKEEDKGSVASADHERGTWTNQTEFLLTVVGYAVGLGNLWRFPGLAYENGGGAFLIPYLTCSLCFGLPCQYLEYAIGQYTQRGPVKAFHYFMPALQGVGWAMALVSATVSIYYNVIVAWSAMYISKIVIGDSYQWATCRNPWNTIYCESMHDDMLCQKENSSTPFWSNLTCLPEAARNITKDLPPMSPAEEFYERWLLEKSNGIDEFGGLNIKMVVCLFVVWVITALCLVRGVALMGKVSYVTSTIPYIFITVLFVRCLMLPGAKLGLDFYLLKPDFSYIFKFSTWKTAATQVCYSQGIGFGGLISLSSFNPRHHNCYRDAVFIVFFDCLTSIIGGVAVFSTLGFMATQSNQPLDKVVQSGTGLAFVAYPEALSQMPVSWLWSLIFFLMFFLIGLASQFGMSEMIVTSFTDQFSSLRKHKAKIVFAMAAVTYAFGIFLCTHSGIFWFNVYNEFTGSFSLILLALIEVVYIAYVYGIREWHHDLVTMFGPPTNILSFWFGPTGILMKISWLVISPAILIGIFVITFISYFQGNMTYGKAGRLYVFPNWAMGIGWFLAIIPLLMIPLFLALNARRLKKRHGVCVKLG